MSHDYQTPNRMVPSAPSALPRRDDFGQSPPPVVSDDPWLNGPPRATPPPEAHTNDDEVVVIDDESEAGEIPHRRRHLPYGRGYVKPEPGSGPAPTPPTKPAPRANSSEGQTRVKILDTWMRSGLAAGDFAPLVGVSKHTLYAWKKRFEEEGPAGLVDRQRGTNRGSKLSETTKRSILLMKKLNPDWGVDRISNLLLRTEALQASPSAVATVLTEDGYLVEESPMRRNPDRIRHFERAKPNQLWQTDLFPFMLKRQNQRVYMVAFMDDHSRYIVSYGLHASQSAALVIETLRAGIASYGTPEEVLTDNGSQYITWRGTSQFQHECRNRGIKQIVASPRRPQTLGKIERFWGTLWRECVGSAIFTDLGDARLRIGHFIDHYNFRRVHSGIDGMVPADRFFNATPAILQSLSQRVASNALELARNGVPKSQFYLAGNVGGTPVVLHAEGDRMMLSKDGQRAEVDFDPRPAAVMPTPASATRPPEPDVVVPVPVAPTGMVTSAWTGPEEQVGPGASALDDLPPLPASLGGAP